MIGRATWGRPGSFQTVVEIDDDGKLTVEWVARDGPRLAQPHEAEFFQRRLEDFDYSPADGYFGVGFLMDLAARYGGVVELGPPPPFDPNCCY